MRMRRNAIKVAHTLPLLTLVVGSMVSVSGASVVLAEGFLNSRGNTAFLTDKTRLLKDMPRLESLVPMPQNINPQNRKRVRGSCRVQVVKGGAPVRGAKGTYESRLVVLDGLTGSFESFAVASGKLRTDREGGFSFDLEIPTSLFAAGFKSGDTAAWAMTSVEFKKRKGSFASIGCDVGARK